MLQLSSLCPRSWERQLLKPECPRACAPQQEKQLESGPHSLQLEKSLYSSKDPAQPRLILKKSEDTPGFLGDPSSPLFGLLYFIVFYFLPIPISLFSSSSPQPFLPIPTCIDGARCAGPQGPRSLLTQLQPRGCLR